jgi:hypothetical protein
MRRHGDVRLPDFLEELTTDCKRKGALGLHDRWKARFEF